MTNIAIEHGHRHSVFFPLNIVIFHSYISLPEGIWICSTIPSSPSPQWLAKEHARQGHHRVQSDPCPPASSLWFFETWLDCFALAFAQQGMTCSRSCVTAKDNASAKMCDSWATVVIGRPPTLSPQLETSKTKWQKDAEGISNSWTRPCWQKSGDGHMIRLSII